MENTKNEIGLAVGDKLLRRKNGSVSVVTVHRVTKTRAFVNVSNYLGIAVYEEGVCKWGQKHSTYPVSDMTGALYEIATPEKLERHNDAVRRDEIIKKIKAYPLEKLSTQLLENILKLLPNGK